MSHVYAVDSQVPLLLLQWWQVAVGVETVEHPQAVSVAQVSECWWAGIMMLKHRDSSDGSNAVLSH